MERITPLELENLQLPTARKGYDKATVDALMKRVASEIQELRKQLQDTERSNETERKELEIYREKEKSMSDALQLAQKVADETRAAAHKEADLILHEARQRLDDLERKSEQVNQDKRNFEMRFRSLLTEYLASLEDAPSLRVDDQEAAAG